MESAVARLKRLHSLSAPGASDATEPTRLSHPRALEEGPSQLRPVCMEVNGHSFETIDSALGESLSEADVPKQKASIPSSSSAQRQMVNCDWHRDKISVETQQMAPVTTSKLGKQRGRPPDLENGVHFTISDHHDISKRNQYELLPKPVVEKRIKKEETQNKKSRSAITSEAMRASWARRRKNNLGISQQAPLTGKSTKQKNHEDLAEQFRTNGMEANVHGPQRQLFKGQHAIRSGSGYRLPVTAFGRHSATGGSKNHNTVDDPPLICKGDTCLIEVFRTCVLPTAVASIDHYRDTLLSLESLQAICKQVVKDTMNEKFVQFLRQCEYKLDRPQKKLIRKYVKQGFAAAAEAAIEDNRKRIFKAQSTMQKSQTESNALFTTNEAKEYYHGHITIVGPPSLYEQESNHGHIDHENALDIQNMNNQSGKAGETEYSEAVDEPGQTGPADRSNVAQPSSDEQSVVHGRGSEPLCDSSFELALGSQRVSVQGKQKIFDSGSSRRTQAVEPSVNERLRKVTSANWDSTLYRHYGPRPLSLWQSLHPSLLKLQTAFDPELELAMARAAFTEAGFNRPYKSLTRGHVDFIEEECLSILHTLDRQDQMLGNHYPAETSELYQLIKTRLGNPSLEKLSFIVNAVSSGSKPLATSRKKKSVRAFLVDLVNGSIPFYAQPKVAKPESRVEPKVLGSEAALHSLLRNRESGMEGRRYSIVNKSQSYLQSSNLQESLEVSIARELRPWKSWKGASSDVVNVAWAPDSLSYAIGAAAQSDDNDLQYNRPNNLLFGHLKSNTISELPDHCIERPRPETIPSGPNSNPAVYDACDPKVYKSITSVHFSPWGGLLYTASQDKTAKIWDVSSAKLPSCICTLLHNSEVTSLEVSIHYPQVFATAAKSVDDSIRVYRPLQEVESPVGASQIGYQFTAFSSTRALKHRSQDIFPECLRWGLAPGSQHLLLGGFQQWADHDFSAARRGQICLWDVHTGINIKVQPHSSAIFAAAWHPQENIFITGGAPGTGALSYPKVTQSVVRLYDPRHTTSYTAEFECPALDIQDVTFHPSASCITAGCTNGKTYVWDYRMPDHVLHQLEHGDPLQELAPNEEGIPDIKHRERVDAGVMLSIWGQGASLFYTGSSDGVIKAWDVLHAPEDVWVKDLAQLPAGVQSGALSPDGMNMLVGDAGGGVHILSAAPLGHPSGGLDDDFVGYNPDPITYVPAENHESSSLGEEGTEGIEKGNELLHSKQLVIHPCFGVGKGPNYGKSNYFAQYARWQNKNTGYWELHPNFDRQQAFNADGVEQKERSTKIQEVVTARREQMRTNNQKVESLAFSFGPPTPFVANRRSSGASAPKPPPMETTSKVPTSRQTPSPDPLGAFYPTPKASSARSSMSRTATPKTSPSVKPPPANFIDLDTYVSPSRVPGNKRKRDRNDSSPSTPTVKRVKAERRPSVGQKVSPGKIFFQEPVTIDLTNDDVDVADVETAETAIASFTLPERQPRPYASNKTTSAKELSKQIGGEEVEENLLTYQEWVEEDHWWPEGW
ncbi:MAG: hypothetical protein Q9209_001378 [Squamulea sp. 1 TL-2023]